jgi:hypothetical protein
MNTEEICDGRRSVDKSGGESTRHHKAKNRSNTTLLSKEGGGTLLEFSTQPFDWGDEGKGIMQTESQQR